MNRYFPSRNKGLERLKEFTPRAGRDYARLRNYDLGPDNHIHVSGLSPYLRHRLITEDEVLKTVLNRHSRAAAEKFIHEVFWRSYWKGWLEMRPSVWTDYRAGLLRALDRTKTESGLRQKWADACEGQTGIDAFDHWARELCDTGYLHNHARMWFASIWIHTLNLPWELGADFFMRHLLDGDPASNTLGWRWVGGMQTIGKTYLARRDNIRKFTENRFDPMGLATEAHPLASDGHPPRGAAPQSPCWSVGARVGVLLHDDDVNLKPLFESDISPVAFTRILTCVNRSPLAVSQSVADFASGATEDAINRWRDRLGEDGGLRQQIPLGGVPKRGRLRQSGHRRRHQPVAGPFGRGWWPASRHPSHRGLGTKYEIGSSGYTLWRNWSGQGNARRVGRVAFPQGH